MDGRAEAFHALCRSVSVRNGLPDGVLPPAFRQWLQAIDQEQDDPDEAALRWQTRARSIAEKLGKQMVMEAGNAALKGRRIVVDKDKKTERTILYTAPKAYNHFRTRLPSMHEAFHRQMSREQIWKSQGRDEVVHLHFLPSDHTYLPVQIVYASDLCEYQYLELISFR